MSGRYSRLKTAIQFIAVLTLLILSSSDYMLTY
jgi:hypothetical protein